MMPFIFAEPARINFLCQSWDFLLFFLHCGNGLCVLSECLIGDERVFGFNCCLFHSCSTDLRLNQPRYATLPNIMKAKSKVIKKYTPQELNVEVKSDIQVVEVTEPPKRKAGVIISSVDELIDKLRNEAHVI